MQLTAAVITVRCSSYGISNAVCYAATGLLDSRHLEVHGDSEAHVRRVARSKPASSAVATA